MANVVVVGAQWGDEGKGKIVDWLSERADVICRFQGGHNAGHTLVIDGEVYKLHALAVGRGARRQAVGHRQWRRSGPLASAGRDRDGAGAGCRDQPETLMIAENTPLILPLARRVGPGAGRGGFEGHQDRHDGARDWPGVRRQGGAAFGAGGGSGGCGDAGGAGGSGICSSTTMTLAAGILGSSRSTGMRSEMLAA